MEFDIKAAAGTSISIPIFESEVSAGIACSADVSVGLLVAMDLVFALDAAIDVEAGFEFSLPEGSFITVDPLTVPAISLTRTCKNYTLQLISSN